MHKCEFGRLHIIDESKGCQKDGKYMLMYNLMRGVPEDTPDMVRYSCEEHVRNIDFVFCPIHGIPEKIENWQTGRNHPGLVREIEKLYERWRKSK